MLTAHLLQVCHVRQEPLGLVRRAAVILQPVNDFSLKHEMPFSLAHMAVHHLQLGVAQGAAHLNAIASSAFRTTSSARYRSEGLRSAPNMPVPCVGKRTSVPMTVEARRVAVPGAR